MSQSLYRKCLNPYTNTSRNPYTESDQTFIQTLQECHNSYTESGQNQLTQHLTYRQSLNSTNHQTNLQDWKGKVDHIKRNHHLSYQGLYNQSLVKRGQNTIQTKVPLIQAKAH